MNLRTFGDCSSYVAKKSIHVNFDPGSCNQRTDYVTSALRAYLRFPGSALLDAVRVSMYICSLYLTSFPYLLRSPSLARYFSVAGSTVPLFDLTQRLPVVHEPLCTLIDAHHMGAYDERK